MVPNLVSIVGICILATALLLVPMLVTDTPLTPIQPPMTEEPAPNPPPDAPQNTLQNNPPQPQDPQKAPITPPKPSDKTLNPMHPSPPNIETKPDLSEIAKMKLIELENNIRLIDDNHSKESKEVEELKHLAKNFYDRSVMYYKAGNYRLSIVYSQLSLEIVHAIEEIRR